MKEGDIFNWLQNECDGVFSCRRLYDPFTDSPTYGPLDKYEVFTIPSQHVTGDTVKEAFENAIKKAMPGKDRRLG
ncbi:MAG: hypothetical protein KAU50_11465 [Candidatus Marinimicrobia bacterium]|nr:hypothetical protein [Candidatus Neomarinimicrobiota bacterium]